MTKRYLNLKDIVKRWNWKTIRSRSQKTSPDASAGEKWQLMERIFKLGEDQFKVTS